VATRHGIRSCQGTSSNPFEALQYVSLDTRLSLCQFSDYPKIIAANWALFEDVFGQEAKFAQHQRAVTEARNALAHNRPLNNVDRASAEAGLLWLEACLRHVQIVDDEEDETEIQEAVEDEEAVTAIG
jgi:hypothetical protein